MNNAVNIPKPSGIGLHLNSIVNVLQAGSSAIVHVKSARNCNFSIWEKKSTHTSNSHISDRLKGSSVFTLPENVVECTDDTGPKNHASVVVESDTSLSTVIMKSSNNPVDDQSAEGNKSVLYTNIETDGISEVFKSNSKKKRQAYLLSDSTSLYYVFRWNQSVFFFSGRDLLTPVMVANGAIVGRVNA